MSVTVDEWDRRGQRSQIARFKPHQCLTWGCFELLKERKNETINATGMRSHHNCADGEHVRLHGIVEYIIADAYRDAYRDDDTSVCDEADAS